MTIKNTACFGFLLLLLSGCLKEKDPSNQSQRIQIEAWYGDDQVFGNLGGHPQRWINILGHASPANEITTMQFSLNGGHLKPLSFLEDKKRLARDGDFNVEILRSTLKAGINTVLIVANDSDGNSSKHTIKFDYRSGEGKWPLPYSIDWSKVSKISDSAQVVDGKWELTPSGVRSVERYYDRVIAFGDESWSNYEVSTTVSFHALTPPQQDPNTTNVTHAAIATRWPGHDPDGNQPSVKWYPVGATAEFRVGDLRQCRWRIFDGKRDLRVESERRRAIELEKVYHMKHRVETLADGQSRYRVKLWPEGEQEPKAWDLERFETDDLLSGSALLIAHHTDVTFGNVQVIPITREMRNQ